MLIAATVCLPLATASAYERQSIDDGGCWDQVRAVIDKFAGIPEQDWQTSVRLMLDVGSRVGCKIDGVPQPEGRDG
jgi:hypothetical protein